MTVITLSYAAALTLGWPLVKFSVVGDGSDYSKITALPGSAPLPTQAQLDAWIAVRARQQITLAIKTKRDALRFNGGIYYAGHWFLSTLQAATEYITMAGAPGPGDTVLRNNWRTMDGAQVQMTPNLAKALLNAGVAQAAAIDDAAQTHKAAVAAASAPTLYDYSGGWPTVYTP